MFPNGPAAAATHPMGFGAGVDLTSSGSAFSLIRHSPHPSSMVQAAQPPLHTQPPLSSEHKQHGGVGGSDFLRNAWGASGPLPAARAFADMISQSRPSVYSNGRDVTASWLSTFPYAANSSPGMAAGSRLSLSSQPSPPPAGPVLKSEVYRSSPQEHRQQFQQDQSSQARQQGDREPVRQQQHQLQEQQQSMMMSSGQQQQQQQQEMTRNQQQAFEQLNERSQQQQQAPSQGLFESSAAYMKTDRDANGSLAPEPMQPEFKLALDIQEQQRRMQQIKDQQLKDLQKLQIIQQAEQQLKLQHQQRQEQHQRMYLQQQNQLHQLQLLHRQQQSQASQPLAPQSFDHPRANVSYLSPYAHGLPSFAASGVPSQSSMTPMGYSSGGVMNGYAAASSITRPAPLHSLTAPVKPASATIGVRSPVQRLSALMMPQLDPASLVNLSSQGPSTLQLQLLNLAVSNQQAALHQQQAHLHNLQMQQRSQQSLSDTMHSYQSALQPAPPPPLRAPLPLDMSQLSPPAGSTSAFAPAATPDAKSSEIWTLQVCVHCM